MLVQLWLDTSMFCMMEEVPFSEKQKLRFHMDLGVSQNNQSARTQQAGVRLLPLQDTC